MNVFKTGIQYNTKIAYHELGPRSLIGGAGDRPTTLVDSIG